MRHADTPVHLEVEVGATVRVEVCDGSAIVPAVRQPVADAEHGRGLLIVEALSLRWGVDRTAGGKRVWVEVPREQA